MELIDPAQIVYINLTENGAYRICTQTKYYISPGWLAAPLAFIVGTLGASWDLSIETAKNLGPTRPNWINEIQNEDFKSYINNILDLSQVLVDGKIHTKLPDGQEISTKILC